jgi:hypothetical protein
MAMAKLYTLHLLLCTSFGDATRDDIRNHIPWLNPGKKQLRNFA